MKTAPESRDQGVVEIKKSRKRTDWLNDKFNLILVIVVMVIISIVVIPSILSVRHKYELKESATDIVSAVKRAQAEAERRGQNVALAIDSASGTCTAFIDDGALQYERAHKLRLTPKNANNLALDAHETKIFTTKIQSIDAMRNSRKHPFPMGVVAKTATGYPTGGITIAGRLYPGVEFNAHGLPINLGSGEKAYVPCPGSSVAGLFSAVDVKSTTNPVDRYQVALNASNGSVLLLTSTNGGECYQ